jgi:hypothetical protein
MSEGKKKSLKIKDWKFKSDIKFNVADFIVEIYGRQFEMGYAVKWWGSGEGMTLILTVRIFFEGRSVVFRYFIGLGIFCWFYSEICLWG